MKSKRQQTDVTQKIKSMIELSEKAKSKAQQRFFGMVRAAQKGEMKNPSKEVLDVADDISVKDAKDFAKTKHKGLPVKVKEEYVIEKEDSPYEKASSGALSGKTRSSGASKTEPKTGFGRKAHRNSAAMIIRAKRKAERSGKKLSDDSAADLAHKGWASSVKHHKSSMTPEQQKRRQKLADTPYKKLSKDEQDKDKVSAKAIMSVHDNQKKKTVKEEKKGRHPRDQKELDRAQEYIKKNPNFGKKEVKENILDIIPTLKDPAGAGKKFGGASGKAFGKELTKAGGKVAAIGAGTYLGSKLIGKVIDGKKKKSKKEVKEESFEIDKTKFKALQKKQKMRNLAIKNTNKNEGDVAHKKAGGPKLIGEEPERTTAYKAMQKKLYPRGSTIDAKTGKDNAIMSNVGGFSNPKNRGKKRKVMAEFEPELEMVEGKLDKIMDTVRKYSKKRKAEKKPEKAMDAGARGRRILQRREYADRISGSTENVPDDIRDHYLHI